MKFVTQTTQTVSEQKFHEKYNFKLQYENISHRQIIRLVLINKKSKSENTSNIYTYFNQSPIPSPKSCDIKINVQMYRNIL